MLLSSLGSSGQSSGGVSDILDGLSQINLSLVSGCLTGSELIVGSSESSTALIDLVGSEILLLVARVLVSVKHFIVLSLFLMNLFFELVEESFDVANWST